MGDDSQAELRERLGNQQDKEASKCISAFHKKTIEFKEEYERARNEFVKITPQSFPSLNEFISDDFVK